MQSNNFKLRIRLPHHRICTERTTDFTADRTDKSYELLQ